jgi:DNA polymerase-1
MSFLFAAPIVTAADRKLAARGIVYNPGIGHDPAPGSLRAIPEGLKDKPMPDSELLLIDFSSLAVPIWKMSALEPDPNASSTAMVDRVRSLASQHPYAAICCDSGKSFRNELDPTYKANRPESDEPMHHQMRLAQETLANDGFPVWKVKGFEADDLIASATARALEIDGATVLLATSDKDMLALVGPRVRVKKLHGDGAVMDIDAIKAKLGIGPEQMADYLALCGDTSDNIIGAKGIGPKKAADLLTLFGSLDALYAAIDAGAAKLQPAVAASLAEFRARKDLVRSLIALRTDVPIPFEEIAAERVAKGQASLGMEAEPMQDITAVAEPQTVAEPNGNRAKTAEESAENCRPLPTATPTQAVAVRQPDAPAPAEWTKHLEPRSMHEAKIMAADMFNARLFNGYGTPAAVLSTILAGRELGLQAMASLRGIHIVEGRHMLSSDLLRALVIRSGLAKTFRCTERTAERATFITQRGDDPPMELSYTIAEASGAGLVKPKSGWEKNPADMLVARASAKLARLVYPDLVHGLYTEAEFD